VGRNKNVFSVLFLFLLLARVSLTKGLAQHQFEKLVARLMGWEAADGQQLLPSGHSSGIESM